MIWRKNIFSYITWFLYTVVTCFALLCLGTAFCSDLKIDVRFGALFAALAVAVPGAVAFGLRHLNLSWKQGALKNRNVRLVAEVSLAVIFLSVGLVLRVSGISEAGETAGYFETARVVMGQEIPQIAHGAVYFYVQLLHGIFVVLGNRFVLGVVLQIILQYLAAIGTFFLLRKLAGSVTALTVLGFFMFSPYMVQCGLDLSPEMLYFCFFTAAAALVVAGWGSKLRVPLFILSGIVISVLTYADVAGILLLPFTFAVIFCERKERTSFGGRTVACLCSLLGFAAGFCGCIFADSLLSGKTFAGVWNVWLLLYQLGSFSVPVTVGALDTQAETLILLGMMALGLFSFWFTGKKERLTPFMLAACAVILGGCFGIFTGEMPGTFYLFFLFTVMAGIGLEQCFAGGKTVEAACVGTELQENAVLNVPAEYMENPSGNPVEGADYPEDGVVQIPSEKKGVQYIENPLPLPRKHVKKVLDYDYPVADDDDFDI